MLNSLLLFVVLFYVYPLKFSFGLMMELFGLAPVRPQTREMSMADAARVMAIYSLGFVVIFLVLALLYRHAWRRRAELRLDELEVFDAQTSMRRHLVSVAVGVLSVATALIASRPDWAGWIYFLMGPVHFGVSSGRRRQALAARLGTAA